MTASGETAARDGPPTPGRGSDTEVGAPAAALNISRDAPTRAQARTRLYRAGHLVAEGFPVASVAIMAGVSIGLYLIFKRRSWL